MFLCLLIKIFLKTSIGKTQPNHFKKSGCIKMLLRRAQHKLLQVRENRNPAARDYNKTPPASRDISSIEKSRMFFIILRTMNRQPRPKDGGQAIAWWQKAEVYQEEAKRKAMTSKPFYGLTKMHIKQQDALRFSAELRPRYYIGTTCAVPIQVTKLCTRRCFFS